MTKQMKRDKENYYSLLSQTKEKKDCQLLCWQSARTFVILTSELYKNTVFP